MRCLRLRFVVLLHANGCGSLRTARDGSARRRCGPRETFKDICSRPCIVFILEHPDWAISSNRRRERRRHPAPSHLRLVQCTISKASRLANLSLCSWRHPMHGRPPHKPLATPQPRQQTAILQLSPHPLSRLQPTAVAALTDVLLDWQKASMDLPWVTRLGSPVLRVFAA